MYTLFAPAPPLRPYIENYWRLRATLTLAQPLSEAIFVDAKADLIFNFGAAYARATPGGPPALITASNLDAQRRYPVSIAQSGAVDLLGVRFRPGGLAPFLTLPVHALSDAVVDLKAAFGAAGGTLEAALCDDGDQPTAQVARLDQFFLARLRPDDAHRRVAAMSAALARDPRASVPALGAQFGYSIRSMDRLFNAVLGFSPKTYARVLRLGAALAALSADETRPLVEIAAASGYYDQAHFTHEFRAFVGATPSAYRALLRDRRETPPPNLVQFLQDAAPAG